MFRLTKRINRATYSVGLILVPVLIFLVQLILGTILSLIPGLQNSLNKSKPDTLVTVSGIAAEIIYFPILLGIALYLLIFIKQRANDISDHGILTFFLTTFTIIGILVLAIIPGQKRQNNYGAVPKSGVHLRH